MNLNMFDLVKGGDIQVGIIPSDLGAGANASSWVSMRNVKRLHILLVMAAGTGVEHVTLGLQQGNTAAGGGAKALNIRKLYYKTGASLAAVSAWTEVTAIDRDNSVASYITSSAGAATLQHAYVFVVDEDDLDTANGFNWVNIAFADVGTARQGTVLFFADAMAYQGPNKATLLS